MIVSQSGVVGTNQLNKEIKKNINKDLTYYQFKHPSLEVEEHINVVNVLGTTKKYQ